MPDWSIMLDKPTMRLFFDLDQALHFRYMIIGRLMQCGISREKADSMYESYVDEKYKELRRVFLNG